MVPTCRICVCTSTCLKSRSSLPTPISNVKFKLSVRAVVAAHGARYHSGAKFPVLNRFRVLFVILSSFKPRSLVPTTTERFQGRPRPSVSRRRMDQSFPCMATRRVTSGSDSLILIRYSMAQVYIPCNSHCAADRAWHIPPCALPLQNDHGYLPNQQG